MAATTADDGATTLYHSPRIHTTTTSATTKHACLYVPLNTFTTTTKTRFLNI